jgi:leucyl/phenylalanyl-tRNA--protein transferase
MTTDWLTPSAHSPQFPHHRRNELFRESLTAKLPRWALGTAFVMLPSRIGALPALLGKTLMSILRGGTVLPSAANVHSRPDGFAGVVRGASPGSLLSAHRLGFYAQSHFGPLKWWSTSQRYVLFLGERTLPNKLRRTIRKSSLKVTFDTAFDEVIKACAEPRPGRPRLTWITPRIMHLYASLHDQGYAHSFELWDGAGKLVGGGYGVAIGKVFVTESQFSRVRDASKIGFQVLNHHLALWGFVLNDVKSFAPHFDNMGFRHISRKEYEVLLEDHAKPHNDADRLWKVVATLDEVAAGGAAGRDAKQPA